jgi:prepilin-type N-terminal cleavage/methylation domain-containing protein/prepilin-type processing-associated H-X9-DG protein
MKICKRQTAFTLIELLVVIAIIGVLISLILPAVQRVREAANRMSCKHHLKNIGLALHSFANVRGRFPPGQVNGPFATAGVTTNVRHGFWPFLLPYIEQEALFKQYRWDVSWDHALNQEAVSKQLRILQCPSAQANRVGNSLPANDTSACTDYAPTREINPILFTAGFIERANNYKGALADNFMASFADIRDGMSNTIFVTENGGRPYLWQVDRLNTSGWVAGGPWASVSNGLIIRGASWQGGLGPGPCGINCSNFQEIYSFHSDGANALFGDGAVHFLKANLSIQVVAKFVTRAGGEVVSAEEY